MKQLCTSSYKLKKKMIKLHYSKTKVGETNARSVQNLQFAQYVKRNFLNHQHREKATRVSKVKVKQTFPYF